MNVAVFVILLMAVVGASLVFGGAPERWTAGMFLVAAILSRLAYAAPAERFEAVETSVATIDVVLLVGIAVILVKADRFWPIAMFAAHGLTVLAHLIKGLDVTIIRHAYAISINSPAYLTLATLAVAVLRHRRRLARHGHDPAWSRTPAAI